MGDVPTTTPHHVAADVARLALCYDTVCAQRARLREVTASAVAYLESERRTDPRALLVVLKDTLAATEFIRQPDSDEMTAEHAHHALTGE